MPSSTPLPATSGLPSLADFGDWLSPMIVKELRQGMRTRVFAGAFLVMQATMVMLILLSLSARDPNMVNFFFWLLLEGLLVLILPLRGVNALSGEIQTRTFELLVLTRLSVFRIALGKWAALVLQGLMIVASLFPFVILLYFTSDINLIKEAQHLLLIWMLSSALTALVIAISALPSKIFRVSLLLMIWCGIFLGAFVIAASLMVIVSPYGPHMGSMDSSAYVSWKFFFAVLLPFWAYFCYFCLDYGASLVAPTAANHAVRKRLVSLGMLLLWAGAVFVIPDSGRFDITNFFALLIWGMASFDSLTEAPTFVSSVYTPFVRRRMLGTVLAWLLAPGWVTGLFYFVVISAIWGGAFCHIGSLQGDSDYLYTLAVIGSVLTPAACAAFLGHRTSNLALRYVMITFIFAVLGVFLLAASSMSGINSTIYHYMSAITPPTALMLTFAKGSVLDPQLKKEILSISFLGSAALFGVALVAAVPMMREMKRAMQRAKASVAGATLPDSAVEVSSGQTS